MLSVTGDSKAVVAEETDIWDEEHHGHDAVPIADVQLEILVHASDAGLSVSASGTLKQN